MGLGLQFARQPDGSVSASFGCDSAYEGHSGMVHGGIVASLLDGAMTNCLFAHDKVAVTADLHVRLRHPLRIGQCATVRAWVTRTCPPLFILAAEVVQDGQVKATAVGKFMRHGNSTDQAIAVRMESAPREDDKPMPHGNRRFDSAKCSALISSERWNRWNLPVSLYGETNPISALSSPEQLVAFAGLDLAVFRSGQYEAPRRRISKRGSPHLRRTLWTMASLAVRKEGELRDRYLHHRRRGLHHLAAVTAVAIKLARIIWRILKDGRDFRSEGNNTPA